LLNSSWMGFAFRAVGEDETAASSLGIRIAAYKIIAFAIGTALAGLAGGLYAFFTLFVSPDAFSFVVSVQVLTMVVIGGAGSTWGVVCAAIFLSLLPETTRFVQEYRLLVFGALLILAIRVAPDGLAGLVRQMRSRATKVKAS
jgi:branched-chain amino acid transport system permease protein